MSGGAALSLDAAQVQAEGCGRPPQQEERHGGIRCHDGCSHRVAMLHSSADCLLWGLIIILVTLELIYFLSVQRLQATKEEVPALTAKVPKVRG